MFGNPNSYGGGSGGKQYADHNYRTRFVIGGEAGVNATLGRDLDVFTIRLHHRRDIFKKTQPSVSPYGRNAEALSKTYEKAPPILEAYETERMDKLWPMIVEDLRNSYKVVEVQERSHTITISAKANLEAGGSAIGWKELENKLAGYEKKYATPEALNQLLGSDLGDITGAEFSQSMANAAIDYLHAKKILPKITTAQSQKQEQAVRDACQTHGGANPDPVSVNAIKSVPEAMRYTDPYWEAIKTCVSQFENPPRADRLDDLRKKLGQKLYFTGKQHAYNAQGIQNGR